MTTYYVATLARYVLVDARDEMQARELGLAALLEQFAGRPFEIRTVRPANDDDLQLQRWSDESAAEEKVCGNP